MSTGYQIRMFFVIILSDGLSVFMTGTVGYALATIDKPLVFRLTTTI